jgi:class 3 adenylate cyclase/tetratricopeptide (TPR) repeat protein
MADRQQLELAIAAQEALRGTVPDDIVDLAVDVLRRQLVTVDAGAQRRRQVTVLFADVSGFTAMAEGMDAELVANVMNDIWARLDIVVTQLGGRIDKHIGDALMAVWGADTAKEDDAERAVHAGLALQQALTAFAAEVGIEVAMRIGISTGLAVVGAVGTTSELTAMGDTVNVASRLEQHAPIGAVLIAHDTYRTVRGVFDVRLQAELTVKGRAAPVRAYVVERAKPRAFRVATRGVEGIETRTIGREDELDALRAAYRTIATRGPARLVTVLADAGTGKSRLLYELLNWVELEPSLTLLFTGRALANRERVALGLFRDVMATRFRIHESDSSSTVATKLRDGFGSRLAPAESDIVGHWLGFELPPSTAVQRLLGAEFATTARTHLIEYFGSISTQDPVVLALEDLHWADDESLDVLVDLLARLGDHHLLVVGLARPTFLDRRPGWPAGTPSATRLVLSPLTDTSSRELVREVLQRVPEPPDELVELIVSRADGNAFYIEELVKMLIDAGAVDTAALDDTWLVRADRLDPSAIPSTLTGVLQARLDALVADERRTLQCASVVGRVFWDAAVTALAPDTAACEAALDAAHRRELVFRRGQSSFDGATEYVFKHALLCDVTYATVLLSERRPLHARAAAWLEAVAGDRLGEYREMIAGHYQAAGQPADAADHLWRVGQAHLTTGTAVAARRSLESAVELWAAAGREPPPEAMVLLAETCLRTDDIDAAQAALAVADRLATTVACRAEVLFHSSWAASSRGERELERNLLDQALPLAEATGGGCLRRTLGGLAWSAVQSGSLDEAERYATRSLMLAEHLGNAGDTSIALSTAATVAGERGDLEACQALVERQVVMAEASGNLAERARAEANLGVVIHLRGDAEHDEGHYGAAVVHYERARILQRRLGQQVAEITTMVNVAQIYIRSGRDQAADALLREALAAAVATGLSPTLCLWLQIEGDRRLTRGETDIGLAYLGLCLAQPFAGSIDRHESDRILARTSLSAEEIERGLAAGAALDLDAVIHELLTRPPFDAASE